MPVHIAPIGEFDDDGFECVENTHGKLFAPLKTHEIPGALLEMRAEFAGQQPSKLYEESALTYA